MALGNTPRKETSFFVEANKSYAFGMRFLHPDETAVDLTDCEIRLVATDAPYTGGTEVIALLAESEDFSTGFIKFNFQAQDLSLDPGSYPYDVTLLPSSGYSIPIIKGYLEVGSNTDTDASNVYANLNATSDVTVTIEQGDVVEVVIEQIDGLYIIVSTLIEDFTAAMAAEVEKAAESASDAEDAADLAASYAQEMQVWLDNAGYPFWKGTQAEYDALTPKREVLYLITDPVA